MHGAGVFGGLSGGEEPAKPKPQAGGSSQSRPLVGLHYERELLLPGGTTKVPSHISDHRERGSEIEREWIEGAVTGPDGRERRIERTLGSLAAWFLSLGFAAEFEIITEQLASKASITEDRTH